MSQQICYGVALLRVLCMSFHARYAQHFLVAQCTAVIFVEFWSKMGCQLAPTMRYETATKVPLNCMLKYYRVSECAGKHSERACTGTAV